MNLEGECSKGSRSTEDESNEWPYEHGGEGLDDGLLAFFVVLDLFISLFFTGVFFKNFLVFY
jgi:hypothetical protein